MLGDRTVEEIVGKTLFSITVGANDFLKKILNTIGPKRQTPNSFEESMVAQYHLNIEENLMYKINNEQY